MTTDATTITPGTVLSGKYEVARELGRGGMATVYEAIHTEIGKRVAIKLLAGELVSAAGMTERLLREARAVSSIRSPHICDVFDAGKTEAGVPYLVLELLQGEALYDRLTRDRQMSVELTLGLMLQVCRGLAKAHEADIVHRDLKPENVFLTHDDDGRLLVKILDFGLAKFYAPVAEAKGKAARLTREGAVFGTPAYMSPEQVKGQAGVDHRSDLWGVACIAYECLTGATVWETDDGIAMTFAHIASAPLPNPAALRPDLPKKFTRWFEKALTRDPAGRFQSAEELAAGLAEAFDLEAPSGALDSGLIQGLLDAAPDARSEQPGEAAGGGAPDGRKPGDSRRSVSTRLSRMRSSPIGRSRAKRGGAGRTLVALGLVGVIGAAGYYAWRKGLIHWRPFRTPTPVASAPASAPASASGAPSGSSRVGSTSPGLYADLEYADRYPWLRQVGEAQQLVVAGDHERALALLRKAYEDSRHAMARNLLEQLQVAMLAKTQGAACQVTGLGRPRRGDIVDAASKPGAAGPPVVAWAAGGALVGWSESRQGAQRAIGVVLDDALRDRRLPVEITPEGTSVRTPVLLSVGDRFLAAYADAGGSTPGVFLRWLGADGVIASAPVPVSEPKPGRQLAAAARSADGGFVVAWAEVPEPGQVELLLRSFGPALEPRGEALHLTDYLRKPTLHRGIRALDVATTADRIHLGYTLAQDPVVQVRYQAFAANAKPPGLEKPAGGATKDRTLGEERTVSPHGAKPSEPSLACSRAGCFVAWQGMQGDAGVAFLDPSSGEIRWQRALGPRGSHPSVAAGNEGEVRLVWSEGGRLSTAKLGADGIGPASKVARVVGDQPAAALAPGATAEEWYLTWLDFEAGRPEPYVARLRCR